MRKVLGMISKADRDFNLIEEGDKIAVGVSGGKDSMAMLYALKLYKNMTNVNYEIIGITLKLGFPNMDYNPVKDFCNLHGIEYKTVDTEVYEVLKSKADHKGNIPCSLCSKFKKALLIDEAKKLGCNKVTMGHHLDDGIETLMMNAIFNGFLSTFQPKMYLDQTDVMFIRPLIYVKEHQLINAVKNGDIPVVTSTCPMDKHTKREEVKHWLEDVYRKFPTAKKNFKNMLIHPERVSLWERTGSDEDEKNKN
ncbi:tRNA 2-thiocytidine biosynthesis TtcA family protein [Haloplasma contractile]|uniref:Cytoplasmic tRNA 2-thiolation protein 1 n=1 Tax=Haloplasma contractile SSD-17B TaxID=1033810 RepID=U2EE98_9MOLU|nr:tRNA 2-thiocytidine biosynthesis TtcA family protein [Haloplasma contractile]ERJ13011.1 cytoplasmic tRNA 2-thiolation protein 1 [Haloplasma contractile SSD-17B]